MRRIGFTGLRARTLVRDLRGPLTYREKDGLQALIAMRLPLLEQRGRTRERGPGQPQELHLAVVLPARPLHLRRRQGQLLTASSPEHARQAARKRVPTW